MDYEPIETLRLTSTDGASLNRFWSLYAYEAPDAFDALPELDVKCKSAGIMSAGDDFAVEISADFTLRNLTDEEREALLRMLEFIDANDKDRRIEITINGRTRRV